MTDRTAKPRSASATEMLEYVLPQHANSDGTVFGGQIMAWVDLCAAICAQRHAGRPCVTAFVDDLLFKRPVRVGQVVRLRAQLTATFRTSMEIEVRVDGRGHVHGRAVAHASSARVVFVAMDEARRARRRSRPAPPLRRRARCPAAAESRRRPTRAPRERAAREEP